MTNPYTRYEARSKVISSPSKSQSEPSSSSVLPIRFLRSVPIQAPSGISRSESDPAAAIEATSRLVALERRLAASEFSHSALAAEIVRLRTELTSQLTHRDHRLSTEANATIRRAAEFSLRANGDSLAQVAAQVQALADKQTADTGVMGLLRNLVKTLEHTMAMNQQDNQHKLDLCATRMSELRDSLNELRINFSTDQQNNRLTEQRLTHSITAVQNSVDRGLERQRVATAAIEIKHQDLDNRMDREDSRLRGEIAEKTAQILRRLAETESQQKEEWKDSLQRLEKEIQTTQKDLETKWKTVGERNLTYLMEGRQKTKQNLRRLDDAVTLLEKQLDEQQRIQENLLAAEIEARAQRDLEFQSKLSQVRKELSDHSTDKRPNHSTDISKLKGETEDRLTKLEEKLKQKMKEINARIIDLKDESSSKDSRVKQKIEEIDQLKKKIDHSTAKIDENHRQLSKSIGKLETDVTSLKETAANVENGANFQMPTTLNLMPDIGKIQSNAMSLHNSMDGSKKIEDLDHWQAKMDRLTAKNSQTLAQLSNSVDKHDDEISKLRSSMDALGEQPPRASRSPSKEDLKPEVAGLQVAVGKISKDVLSLKSAKEKLEKDTVELKASTKQLQKDINHLKDKPTANEPDQQQNKTKPKQADDGDDDDGGGGSGGEKDQPNDPNLNSKVEKLEKRMSKAEESVSSLRNKIDQTTSALKEDNRKLAETIQIVKTVTGLKIQAEHRSRMELCQELEGDIENLKTEIDKIRKDAEEKD